MYMCVCVLLLSFLTAPPRRFDVPDFVRHEDTTEDEFALFRTQVQLRVGNALKMWIEGFFADFSHGMVPCLFSLLFCLFLLL